MSDNKESAGIVELSNLGVDNDGTLQQQSGNRVVGHYATQQDLIIIYKLFNHNTHQLMQTEKVITGCPLGCSCEKCLAYGFTERLLLDNPDMLVYSGPIMTRMPVSNFHNMVGMVTLSYKTFHTYPLSDIVKLKATYSDFMPGLSRIYLTLRPDQHKDEITVNQLDAAFWFIHLVRVKLYGISNYGIPFRKYEGKIIGKVWIKRFFEGWVLTGVEITDRLRIEKQNEIRNIKQFWTRFEIIDVQGLCLVVKFWDFLTKWEIGIPLKQLGLWLSAFLSLLKS